MRIISSPIRRHQLTNNTDSTITSVESGDIEKEAGFKTITGHIEELKVGLTAIVTSLTGAAGFKVEGSQLNSILALVNVLVFEVLATCNGIVVALGLRGELSVVLKVVFGLVAKILFLLISVAGGLVPGLLGIVHNCLSIVGHGILSPVLKPIFGLVTGLGGSINL